MNDLIRRDDIGLTDFEIIMCDGDYKEALKMLLQKIEDAPAVEAESIVHGHWILNSVFYINCSVCGFNLRDILDDYSSLAYNYEELAKRCLNCGAKMDEVVE